MNFLAHLYLADPTPDSRIGNLIADFVKGPAVAALPPAVLAGVMRHRRVDGFTDRHPIVVRSIHRVSRDWGWFAGILIDVYYDHILARDWSEYVDQPLRAFADDVYESIRDGTRLLPAEHSELIIRLIADDRLTRYATLDGIADTFVSLSSRIAARMPTRAMRLEDALPALTAADAELTADFRQFFPQLVARVRAGELG